MWGNSLNKEVSVVLRVSKVAVLITDHDSNLKLRVNKRIGIHISKFKFQRWPLWHPNTRNKRPKNGGNFKVGILWAFRATFFQSTHSQFRIPAATAQDTDEWRKRKWKRYDLDLIKNSTLQYKHIFAINWKGCLLLIFPLLCDYYHWCFLQRFRCSQLSLFMQYPTKSNMSLF